MHNLKHKNWNNFALGLLVMLLPLLAVPAGLKSLLFIVAGFFIALFSLAAVGAPPDDHASPPQA